MAVEGGLGARRAHVFLGGVAGLEPTSSWTVSGGFAAAGSGNAVTTVGDVDGDGFEDVVLAAPDDAVVRRYQGGPQGLADEPSWVWATPPGGAWGASVAAGDLDADGVADLVGGAPFATVSTPEEGAAFAFVGCVRWSFYEDADGDGLGDPAVRENGCTAPAGFVDNADDPCPGESDEDCVPDTTDPTEEPPHSTPPPDATTRPKPRAEAGGCGCAGVGPAAPPGLAPLVALVALRRAVRRGRAPGRPA